MVSPEVVVWRPLTLGRWGFVASMVVLAGILTAAAVLSPEVWWLALFDVPIAVLAWSHVRAKAELDHATLRAVGRFTTKEIPLRRVTQVSEGVGDLAWLRARDGDDADAGHVVVPLRMIGRQAFAQSGGGPAAAEAVTLIRERAERAGAQLEPPLPGPTPIPPGWHVVFGA